MADYLVTPPGDKGPGVPVLHAWRGLNAAIRSYCDRVAAEGFTVLAPDYYGGAVATSCEEARRLTEGLDRAKAEFLGHLAENDEFEDSAYVEGLRRRLQAAGRPASFHAYAGTRHWFAESDRPEYHAPSATLAWERTVKFLRRHLGPSGSRPGPGPGPKGGLA